MHFVIPKLHHMWSTRFCIIILLINHQICLDFFAYSSLVRERVFVLKRENGFKDSQENSHVQEPTAASFNQILSLGDYSAISLSSLFACSYFPLIQFLHKPFHAESTLKRGNTSLGFHQNHHFHSLSLNIFHLINQSFLGRLLTQYFYHSCTHFDICFTCVCI